MSGKPAGLPVAGHGLSHYKSKTLATWIAILGGSLGLHRFYLHGWRDGLGWLHPLPTLAGLHGVRRMLALGQDDQAAWALIPLLGLMLAQAMLFAILYGLTPDERWDARHNPGQPGQETRWGPVLGAIAALMLGAGVLMATIAFSGQRYFEWQIEQARQISQ
ncbi:TM2 domain-containing protein [Azohydromonas caseinilytica]|uniref:TM2 domain-containing protein n=1 Tax=Azohydromonas caseinilytica TaxID=2728836 RepID=A0A848F4X1_9BURK|nr:TM2 domain-containing protein [Azohydromonas caseinilytica]NML14138.1 TM2 domain-containing protein [Azohydromonas caseinilytica]